MLCSISNCEFIISLFSLSFVLSITYHASKLLQGINHDILSANNVVDDIMSVLENNRLNCNSTFQNIYIDSKTLMDELDIQLKMPRIIAHQKNRSNPSSINNCEDYFKITIFIPLLDCVIIDLKKRFYGQENQTIKMLTNLVPKNVIKWSETNSSSIMVEYIKNKYTFFQNVSNDLFNSELELWIKKIGKCRGTR